MSKYKDILKQYWGYDSFRELQEDIISSICEGKDTLGLMPTGGGKSITFQVPALSMEGLCLVITPLIALMKDQVRNLRDRGIKAVAIYSGMSRSEVQTALENCLYGKYKFLYISPERLSSETFRTKIKFLNVSMITVDESHCISQWGYDFRPSYLKICDIRKLLPSVPVLALTATATPLVVKDIQEKLEFKAENSAVFQMSFERKNLAYIVRKTENREDKLIEILQRTSGSAIVYVRSRQKAKDISELIAKSGITATFYHAGLKHSVKDSRQKEWVEDKTRVIVATNAFGMGIDKPDVRLVVHIDLPDSIEAYFQEAGRAGRDGKKAYAVILSSKTDKAKMARRVEDTFPDRDYIKAVYEDLNYYYQMPMGEGMGRIKEFDLEQFCMRFKHFPVRAYSALKLLMQAGYIEYIDEQENASRLLFYNHHETVRRVSDEADSDMQKVVMCILRTYTGVFTDPIYISEEVIAEKTGITREKVYNTLLFLSRLGEVQYVPRKRSSYIVYTANRQEKEDVFIGKDIYEDRLQSYRERIDKMLEYSVNDGVCRSRLLLEYFGEHNESECGICDVCIEKRKAGQTLKEDTFNIIKRKILSVVEQSDIDITQLPTVIGETSANTSYVLRNLIDEELIQEENGRIKKITNKTK